MTKPVTSRNTAHDGMSETGLLRRAILKGPYREREGVLQCHCCIILILCVIYQRIPQLLLCLISTYGNKHTLILPENMAVARIVV